MFKKVLYASCFTLISMPAFADAVSDGITVTSGQSLSFGKFAQTAKNSTVMVDSTGSVSYGGGAVASSAYAYYKPQEGRLVFSYNDKASTYGDNTPGNTEITLTQESSVNASGCSANIGSLTFSDNGKLAIVGSEGGSVSTGVGATLTLNGYCKEGSYSGVITVNYEYVKDDTSFIRAVRVPYSFEVEEPLAAGVGDDMNFGMWIAPSKAATIVLPASTSGPEVTKGSMIQVGNKAHPATVSVKGVGGRSVSINMPASMKLNYGGSAESAVKPLDVTNFIFASQSSNDCTPTASVFTLPDLGSDEANARSVCNFYVGATLDVGESPTPGTYSGQVNVTFIYTYN